MSAVCGVYIAFHPHLAFVAAHHAVPGIIKIGESSRLNERIHDSAYTTTWIGPWSYLATFETENHHDARKLEAYLLYRNKNRILNGQELVAVKIEPSKANATSFASYLTEEAARINIPGTVRVNPCYERLQKPTTETPPRETERQPLLSEIEAPLLTPLEPITPPHQQSSPLQIPTVEEKPQILRLTAVEDREEDEVMDAVVAEIDVFKPCDMTILHTPIEDRPYQIDAAKACAAELQHLGRTQLVMACRCGKTRVAHMTIEKLRSGARDVVLFLVPSIQLARDTANKFYSYGVPANHLIMVGSGPATGGSTPGDEAMTTNHNHVKERIHEYLTHLSEETLPPLMVISTYQSSEVAAHAMQAAGSHYAVTVFDECHRICGATKKRPANEVLLNWKHLTPRRLFMTATPAMDAGKNTIHMGDHAIFGNVAYRYHLRQGIDAGYVNDFEVQLVSSSRDAFDDIHHLKKEESENKKSAGLLRGFLYMLKKAFRKPEEQRALGTSLTNRLHQLEQFYEHNVRAAQIGIAYYHLVASGTTAPGAPRRNKMLVFCNTINDARALSEKVAELFTLLGGEEAAQVDWASVHVLTVHSKMSKADCVAVSRRLADPAAASIVFNCRMFQEGVEFKHLNAVYFAARRSSSRDIVQSMMRPLTLVAGKPPSVIYIPTDPAQGSPDAQDDLTRLGRFRNLLPYADALLSEDSRFYDHLMNPHAHPYPLGWLGAHGAAAPLLALARRSMRTNCGARVGNKLVAHKNIPWAAAFAHLRHIVTVCRRYPKSGDGFELPRSAQLDANGNPLLGANGAPLAEFINFMHWFDWAKKQYVKFVAGEPSDLTRVQVENLESLPHWEQYGVPGPYPARECLAFLEHYMDTHGGELPPLSVGVNAEWTGLDATPYERLSGFLRTVNQQDAKGRRFTVNPRVAAELDRIFEKYGRTWRTERHFTDEEVRRALHCMAHGLTPDGAPAAGAERVEVTGTWECRRAKAEKWLTARGKIGEQVVSGGRYAGTPTDLKLRSEGFAAWAAAHPGELARFWPEFPHKHENNELPAVLRSGQAPPRFIRGKNNEPDQLLPAYENSKLYKKDHGA